MTSNPMFLLYKILDDIVALQNRSIRVQATRATPSWPDCVSRTPRFGTAISPLHAVYANHFPVAVGSELNFGGEKRIVTKTVSIGGDIGVASWDKKIRATPMRVLPWDWRNFLSTRRDQETLRSPILCWRGTRDYQLFKTPVTRNGPSGVRVEGVEGAILAGDSGGPIFLALPQPVLLGCMSGGNGGSCLSAHWQELVDATSWYVQEADWDIG